MSRLVGCVAPAAEGLFQSRAGFSECLDVISWMLICPCFWFQSRAGFSECLDLTNFTSTCRKAVFQSRAGFSECLDRRTPIRLRCRSCRFNPVLGFLSVSTEWVAEGVGPFVAFQSRAGFSECLDAANTKSRTSQSKFQSRAGFSECLDHRQAGRRRLSRPVSIPCWVF